MGAALVLAYLPWIYELHRAADPVRGLGQNIGWVGRPGMKDIASALVILNRPFSFSQSSTDPLSDPISIVLVVLLFIAPLLFLGWQSVRKQNQEGHEVARLRGLFLFAFAPAVTCFVASWILPYSIWGTRHLIIAAGPYAILVAIAVMRLRPYWIKTTILMLMGCWFLLAATLLFLLPQRFFIWCAWEHMAKDVVASEPAAGEAVRVYAYEDLVAYHLWFALGAGRNTKFKLSAVKGIPGIPEDPAYFLQRY